MAYSEDGEVGAVHAAKVATAALIRCYGMGRVVTLGVKGGRESQNMGWAKLDTKPTPFTAFDGNGNKTLGQ